MEQVTFVVTNYNYGRFVPRLFRSLKELNNKYHFKYHLIIGDDASSDESVKVIDECIVTFGNLFEKCTFICNEKNGGKNSLLNKMLPLLETEFSVIIDADDWLGKAFLDTTYAVYHENRNDCDLGFIYSNCTLCHEDESPVGLGRSTGFSMDLLQKSSYIPQTCLVRSEALKSSLPLDENIRVGTKHHKWKRMCAKGWKGFHVPESLFFYRMHGYNISSIGKKVLSEDANDVKERILQGYWPLESSGR